MASCDWQLEMENMLAAFNRQAIHSLTIIKSTFNRSGLLFTPTFKKHFMQVSINCLNEAYDRFQVNSLLQEQLSPSLSSVATVSKGSTRNDTDGRGNGTSISNETDWKTNAPDSDIQIEDFFDDEAVIETFETEATEDTTAVENDGPSNANANEMERCSIVTQNISGTYNWNKGPLTNDELHETNNGYESNMNEDHIIKAETDSDLNFDVELDESNDSIEMVENQTDPKDADDKELIPVNIDSKLLYETASNVLTQGETKTTRLNRKSPNKKRMMKMEETKEDGSSLTTKGTRPASKQSVPRNQKRCTVCGYVCGRNFNQHMRTHTGEKPYGCDRCGKRYTRAEILLKHAAKHIGEFPFHCRACFRGFSSRTEAVAHEKHCRRRRYECHLCKKFVTCIQTQLTAHMRIHTGDKPFRCEICGNHFTRKQTLKGHLNNVHAKINKRK